MKLTITPSVMRIEARIPDATPGVVGRYALNDKQALLTRLRYNRLIDIFTALTCYSLQNHLRTSVRGIAQVETDEIYVGVDKRGVHYVLPVRAEGKTGRIGVARIERDLAVCKAKFPGLICRSVAAILIEKKLIALFECEQTSKGIRVTLEKHYRLVDPREVAEEG